MKKRAIYQKYQLNLIDLEERDICNLDDVLPKKLFTWKGNRKGTQSRWGTRLETKRVSLR